MIYTSFKQQLQSLLQLLERLSDESYRQKSILLGEVSIGQHTRHIIELAQALLTGYGTGEINYDLRKRDLRIEQEKSFAAYLLQELILGASQPEKELTLVAATGSDGENRRIPTWYHRELVYNTEHAIHHMALIRVALREMNLNVVDDSFGLAYATIQYQQKVCAQ